MSETAAIRARSRSLPKFAVLRTAILHGEVARVATSFYGQRGDPAGPLAEFGPTLAAVFGLKQCAVAQAGE